MFEYGNPDAILDVVLTSPLKPNEAGHTALEDFDYVCSLTGCPRDDAWAKLAYVFASRK